MNSDNDELPKPPGPQLNSEDPIRNIHNIPNFIPQAVSTGTDDAVVTGAAGLNPIQVRDQSVTGNIPIGLEDTPIADDSDLIEKEWVIRLKAVVERNINNPYNLNIEVDHIKEDYQKKRYNREPVVKV